MVARALLDELTYGSVSRRERPVAAHIPYTRHVTDTVIRTRDGPVMTILKLEGYSFETADMSAVNSRLLARNDVVRTLANSRFALVSHIIRREVEPSIPSTFDNALCREIDERYQAALSTRRMFVNDLYLTIVRRQLQGQAGTFESSLSRLLGRKDSGGQSVAVQTALSELHDASTAVRETLSAYGARPLGVVSRDGVWFSEALEFLVQLVNGGVPRPMHLPRMRLAEALSQKRIFFGRNAVEIRGASPDDTRFGAMISIREYPAQTGPGSFDNLLRVPHEFIATQSFAIVDRPEAAKQIDRVSRQVDMSDEAGSIVSEQLNEARDDLLASEAIYGEHHMTVMCLGRGMAEVDAGVTAVGAALTDRSVIWTREDLNCEPAFWAQLPGNFPYIARKSIISSKNFAGFSRCTIIRAAGRTVITGARRSRSSRRHRRPRTTTTSTSATSVISPSSAHRDLARRCSCLHLGAVATRARHGQSCCFVDKDRGAEIFIRALGGQYEVLTPASRPGSIRCPLRQCTRTANSCSSSSPSCSAPPTASGIRARGRTGHPQRDRRRC
jgi:type IV secretion system protein VirB4